MKLKVLFSIIFILLSTVGMAESSKKESHESKKDSKDNFEAKVVMNQVYESFMKLIPYIYTDKLISEGKEKAVQDEIINNLLNIQIAFKNAKHINLLKIPGFKPSLETINSHIQDTIDAMNAKNKVFAHERLKAVTALCVSCHSGLSEKLATNSFSEALVSVNRNKFESDYAFANYLFLVRKFSESKKYYELAIKNALKKSETNHNEMVIDDKVVNGDIFNSLRRVLTIYTKISLNPDAAIEFLKQFKDSKKMNKFTRSDIDLWMKSLEKWKKFDSNSVKNIGEFIETYLKPIESRKDKVNSGEHDITLLVASGVLTKFLSDSPKSDLTPSVLYWLSIAERRLSTSYFFSLSDLYLKECITQYPKSEYAKKCYQEYEDNLIFGYSGSGGTDIPQGERKELERLKSYLK